jgi:hypothetical protein
MYLHSTEIIILTVIVGQGSAEDWHRGQGAGHGKGVGGALGRVRNVAAVRVGHLRCNGRVPGGANVMTIIVGDFSQFSKLKFAILLSVILTNFLC